MKFVEVPFGVAKNLGHDAAPKILAPMIGYGCRAAVRMPKELVAAPLPHLRES
jgi:hypothetical protein